MIDTKLNAALGKELRAVQERRRKSTVSLARHLGIQRQEMLQILQGSKLPTEGQLESLINLLVPEPKTVAKLRLLLMEAVRNACNAGSWDPVELKKMRIERKLSLPTLSLRTGIPTSRLGELECRENGSGFSDDEIVSLRKIFPQLGEKKKGALYDDSRIFSLLEGFVPVVTLEDMSGFSPEIGLSSFAMKTAKCNLCWNIDCVDELMAVAADASDLQLEFPGVVILAVKAKKDYGESAPLLCCDTCGKFSLQECKDGKFSPLKWFASAAVVGDVAWTLPVVDVVIKPLKSLKDANL